MCYITRPCKQCGACKVEKNQQRFFDTLAQGLSRQRLSSLHSPELNGANCQVPKKAAREEEINDDTNETTPLRKSIDVGYRGSDVEAHRGCPTGFTAVTIFGDRCYRDR